MRTILTLFLLGLAFKAMPQIITAEYFYDDPAVPYGKGTPLAVAPNTGEVMITATLPVNDLSPGFHQAFFRVRHATEGWSSLTPKAFLKPWPTDTIEGFRYRIDPLSDGSTWVSHSFASPSTDVDYTFEIDLGDIAKGVHYIEAMAMSNSGAWTPVSKGTFFNLHAEPMNITSLEYYFEDEDSAMSPLYTVDDFSPSPNVTLDSVTFTIPVTSLVNLRRYFMYIRAIDETGNRGPYMKDTLVYHGTTGLKDRIYLAPDLMAFPNPAEDLLNMKLITLDKARDYILRIYDEAGRIITEREVYFSSEDCCILEIAWLTPGLYRIAVCTSAGNQVAKGAFVKR
ncbi:MAG: hypothetical protein JXK95_12195 [Bacteroidales bacterium]|nr:hypothetical protein [Bacteroidales bacterium]